MKAPSPRKAPSISTPEAVIKRRIKEAKKKGQHQDIFHTADLFCDLRMDTVRCGVWYQSYEE